MRRLWKTTKRCGRFFGYGLAWSACLLGYILVVGSENANALNNGPYTPNNIYTYRMSQGTGGDVQLTKAYTTPTVFQFVLDSGSAYYNLRLFGGFSNGFTKAGHAQKFFINYRLQCTQNGAGNFDAYSPPTPVTPSGYAGGGDLPKLTNVEMTVHVVERRPDWIDYSVSYTGYLYDGAMTGFGGFNLGGAWLINDMGTAAVCYLSDPQVAIGDNTQSIIIDQMSGLQGSSTQMANALQSIKDNGITANVDNSDVVAEIEKGNQAQQDRWQQEDQKATEASESEIDTNVNEAESSANDSLNIFKAILETPAGSCKLSSIGAFGFNLGEIDLCTYQPPEWLRTVLAAVVTITMAGGGIKAIQRILWMIGEDVA